MEKIKQYDLIPMEPWITNASNTRACNKWNSILLFFSQLFTNGQRILDDFIVYIIGYLIANSRENIVVAGSGKGTPNKK